MFKNLFIITFIILFTNVCIARSFPMGTDEVYIPKMAGVRSDLLKNISQVIKKSIANGDYPGAVVLVGHNRNIIYRGVFGNQSILPSVKPMQFDTIFDIASLTKVFVTTPAIMQLVEQNKINLDAKVSTYWPKFANHGKSEITIRELLTHTSGLPPDLSAKNFNDAIYQIENLKVNHEPGTTFIYSDLNFVTLAYLVEKITGENFAQYANEHIFKVLKLKNTMFLPPNTLLSRIAPTELVDKKLKWGSVQDPLTDEMGGVSGAAGVFSNAYDLGIYAQCLLDGGKISGSSNYLLSPLTILKMTTRETPPNLVDARGFGWDMDSRYSDRGVFFTNQSYGHTGYTGTSLWIDPQTNTWIVILTSRLHPTASKKNQLIEDRREISNIVAVSLTDIITLNKTNTTRFELFHAYFS